MLNPRSLPRGARLAAAATLLSTLAVAPVSAFAQMDVAPDQDGRVFLANTYRPYYRIVPPSTDPAAVQGPGVDVAGVQALRGTVLFGEGDLVLISLADGREAVVRVPRFDQFPASAFLPGTTLDAIGMSDTTPIFDAVAVSAQVRP